MLVLWLLAQFFEINGHVIVLSHENSCLIVCPSTFLFLQIFRRCPDSSGDPQVPTDATPHEGLYRTGQRTTASEKAAGATSATSAGSPGGGSRQNVEYANLASVSFSASVPRIGIAPGGDATLADESMCQRHGHGRTK